MTNDELRCFIEWEGGLEGAIGHGIDDADPIEDERVRAAWDEAVEAYAEFERVASQLTALLGL